jgi:hypothetical protein
MLKRMFVAERQKVTMDWMKLHNEELHNLPILPSVVREIKSRMMSWAGHVAYVGENEKCILNCVWKMMRD